MKKLICLAMLLMPFVSCVSRSDVEKIIGQRDSLSTAAASRDSILFDVLQGMNIIAENLADIKEREGLLAAPAGGELEKDPAARISEDIAAIDRLLAANRREMERLQNALKSLREAEVKMSGLESIVADLNERLDVKDAEIASLKSSLESMGVEVETLGDIVRRQDSTIVDLAADNAELRAEAESAAGLLHTAYYIIGSQKELLNSGVLYKTGFVGRTLKLNENRSLDDFTRVDTRTLGELFIGQSDVTLVTTHPTGSYRLVESVARVVERLEIIDPERFWAYSKVLVVSYK